MITMFELVNAVDCIFGKKMQSAKCEQSPEENIYINIENIAHSIRTSPTL